MAQNQSAQLVTLQQLNKTLGHSLSETEFQSYLEKFKFLQPKVGKFWQGTDVEAGIYILIAGKVRLLDKNDELVASLDTGASFGEFTLFNDAQLQSYGARASVNLQLCFIPGELLSPLMSKYPQIREHLWNEAHERNSLLVNAELVNSDESPEARDTGVNTVPNVVSTPVETIQTKKKISKAYFPTPTQQVGHLLQRFVKRYPFFAQQSGSDCGAACLVMVSRYWGKRFSVNRLRDIANVDRNGASLRGLSTAAESIGFSTRPVKASLEQLAKQKLPAIVHWEGKHYIVVYEINAKHVIVCDPAIGQRTLSHAQFKEKWSGYTLLLQPTAFLKEAKEATTAFWQFFELIKPHSLVMLEVFMASLFIQIFGLINPLFTQLILDRVVVQRSELTLTAVGIGLLMFSLFQVAMIGLRQYLLDHTANKIDLALIVAFIRHTLRLPLSYFESRFVGDIIARVQENRKIQRFLSGEALSILLDLLTVFIYVGLMFWYSWRMALLALIIVPPFLLLALFATPFLQKVSQETFNAVSAESSYLIEALSGVKTVKSSAVEQTVRWHWEDLLHKEIKTKFTGQVISNRLQIFSNSIEAVTTTVLLWFGASLVINNQLSIGQLVAFNMLLGNIINPFKRLTVLWNQLQEVIIAVERINDVLDAEPEEDFQHEVRQYLPKIKGNIRFEKVTFRYHPESEINILENLSFTVKPGQMVALVGRSGSGKTTISKLVLGLYPPTESSEIDTPNGKVAAYNLEIALKQNCIASNNKCIPLRPGDTATAEVIVRQRRIIDFLLDPFKKLQQGDLKL